MLAHLPPDWQECVPIFASLSQWENTEMELLPFLQDQIRELGVPALADRLADLMEQGRVVLLLDGLNELPQLSRNEATGLIDDHRAKAIARLGDRSETRRVRCVLSCREKDFAGDPYWRDLRVQNLTPDQIHAFAVAFYKSDPGKDDPDAEQRAERFLAYVNDDTTDIRRRKLQELAIQPFYLVKLLSYFYRIAEVGLPTRRVDLLEYTVEDALARLVEGQQLTKAQGDEVRAGLSLLAFNLIDAEYVGGTDPELATAWLVHLREQEFQDGSGGWTPQPTPEQAAQARELMQWATAAGLLYTTKKEVSFYHELLQEYFCARQCFATGLTPELLERTTYRLFDEVWPLWAELDGSLLGQLIRLLTDAYDSSMQSNAAYALGRIGDQRAVEPLILALMDQNMGVHSQAARALGRIGDQRAVLPLITLLEEGYYETTLAAAQALSSIGPSVVPPLLDSLEGMHGIVLRDAVRALGWIGDARALPALERLEYVDELVEKIGVTFSNVATKAIAAIKQAQQ